MELISRIHRNNLVSFAKDKPDVLVLSADLTSSCEADLFRDSYPERFVSCGIAEQNMMSVAGGLAREGFVPFVHTFAVFIYRRAYDQVAMSVAYPNTNVKMFGFLPGITTPGGSTHQAIEDIALMSALPNMTVLEIGDATELESVCDLAYSLEGPVYVRMLRGEVPRLFDKNEGMKLGVPRILREGTDIAIVSSGICTEESMRAVKVLQSRGIDVGHIHIGTLKPFGSEELRTFLSRARGGVITVENHTVMGGLGSKVAESMLDWGLGTPLCKLGLQDTFAHGASKAYLMRSLKIDALAVAHAAQRMMGQKEDIDPSELDHVRLEPVHSLAKAEAL